MEKQYGEFVGVESVFAAVITEDSEAAYITETPEYFAPTGEIAGEPEVNNTSTYYDNAPGFNYVTEGVTTLTLTISGIPAQKAAKYLGKYYDPATGRVLDTGVPEPPDVALSFRFNKGPSGFRYYQYLKGTFSGGSEEAASKSGGGVDVRTYRMTYTAVVTSHKWEINGEPKGLKRIFADTTDPAFNPTGWFSRVQTPDAAASPAQLTLVSSVPADDATGVAVDANLVLTFSNKIASSMITLVGSEGAVPFTKVLDAAGKVLTLKPNANLASSAAYTLVIAQAKDIYGQLISSQIITFTTV